MSDSLAGAPQPALRRLLARDPASFAADAWGRHAVLAQREDRGGDDFSDLFSTAAVDELVTRRGLRTPFLRMAKGGSTLHDSAYTAGGGIGAGVADQVSDDRVRRLFADGATIVLQGLHRTWEPVIAFSQQLAADLGHPVQVNSYVTPAQSQGFSDHYDVHDVFVLQIHGEKEWTIHAPVLDAPLRDQPWGDRGDEVRAAAAEPPVIRTTLRPGDCLYLPRGFIHAARALGGTSIHLTIGVHPWTRHHLAESLLDAVRRDLGEDPAARGSLALGVDVADPSQLTGDVEAVRAALVAALSAVDASVAAAALQGQARAAQRPAALGPLDQVRAAASLTPDSRLRARPHLHASLDDATDGIVVRSRAGRFTVGAELRAPLARLLAGDALAVRDLTAEADEALPLARTLLIEGVALAD